MFKLFFFKCTFDQLTIKTYLHLADAFIQSDAHTNEDNRNNKKNHIIKNAKYLQLNPIDEFTCCMDSDSNHQNDLF